MNVDPNGNAWYNVLGWIGVGLVVAAATVLTCGSFGVAVGGAGLLVAVIHSAAVGALIVAGAGAALGAVGGMVYDASQGNDFGTSIWEGVQAGFGIGAIAGVIIGGAVGGFNYASANSLLKSYQLPDSPNYDCSEIADDLFQMANGKGKIINITPKNSPYLNVYSKFDDFVYHTVYSKGGYILDPRFSANPVLKSTYMRAIRLLSNGIKIGL